MNFLQRINKALLYIEENLDGYIDVHEMARLSLCPVYQFQKIFSTLSDLPLSEYIRNRRLDRAAYDLRNSDEKIIDIALKYGYDSPTAFNRAFKNLHGAAPSAVRQNDAISLKAFPPVSFQITVKGAVKMNYRIIQQKSFRAVGAKLSTTTANGEQMKKIPPFWNELRENGKLKKIIDLCEAGDRAKQAVDGMLGLCFMAGETIGGVKLDYYIAAASDAPAPEGLDEIIVPECTYAVFDCVGPMPGSIQTLTKQIYSEWLPSSGYDWANAPDIEQYSEGNNQSSDYKSWVWLPVVKKS